MLSTLKITTLANSTLSPANAFSLDHSKILSFGIGLKDHDHVSETKTENYLVNPFLNKPWFLHIYSRRRFENTVGR